MRIKTFSVVAFAAIMMFAASAQAASNTKSDTDDRTFKVVPKVFAATSASQAMSVCGGPPSASNGGQVHSIWDLRIGLPQTAETSEWGLFLEKALPTADCSAALANITGISQGHPLLLTELGFDVDNNGATPLHCGAGAPRYNVVLTDGSTFFFGCTAGTHTNFIPSRGAPWSRVRFSNADAFAASPSQPTAVWPGFGFALVAQIQIVMDEGIDVAPDFSGQTILDNIDINGLLIGGPESVTQED
jgi:hypothetical protein